jgi:putative chitobiose transport system permease protein
MARLGGSPYRYLCLPFLVILLFFTVPLAMAFWMSLQDYSGSLYSPRFAGMDNYRRLLESGAFWQAVKQTFIFLLGVVPCMVILPVFMALLTHEPLPGIKLFRSLLYLPVIVSAVVVAIAWRWLYASDGLLNWFLSLFGIGKTGWLVNPDIALFSLMVVVVWKGLAYYMMMYLAHLQTLSEQLHEAARMDGAGFWQRQWHITLPHLKPTMIMVGVLSSIACFKIFTEMYVMTRGGPIASTKTLVYFIYERAFEHLDLGIACAAGIFLMLFLLMFGIVEMLLSGRLKHFSE